MFNPVFILALLYANIFSDIIAAFAYFFDRNIPMFWNQVFTGTVWFLFLNYYLKQNEETEKEKNDK